MELKQYQRGVIDDLCGFLSYLNPTQSIATSYKEYWESKKVNVGLSGIQPYQDKITGVPNVCLKVPTGGGKTFLAASAIRPIFDAMPHTKSQAVVWLVPSDAILEQTMKNLSNPHHPYRQRININFSHRVEVYSKSQLLNGQNFNPTVVNEQLSIFVLSYDSFRTSKKEGRKAFQENGNLAQFAQVMNNPDVLLADTDETALIQVIRALNPIVIVDESHHATSKLSIEMLQNFNPAFILDLTATPQKDSNIISYVDALQLKKENMVKLPVIVYNRPTQTEVLSDAITIRSKLELAATHERKTSERYIRPIALIQAEPKNNADSKTFEKIKKDLIESGIPEATIAIKTADKNELRGVDLLSEDCPIRYIITVNALKEGWDCPFAYVLATIANRTSQVDVEQILGRILRLPNTTRSSEDVLNISYVITSSNDFHATLGRVVAGLNRAGFSEQDYRIAGEPEPEAVIPSVGTQINLDTTSLSPNDTSSDKDDIVIDTEVVRQNIAEFEAKQTTTTSTGTTFLDDPIFSVALKQADTYEQAVEQSGNNEIDHAPLELKDKMNVFRMRDEYREQASKLRLPQFMIADEPTLFTQKTTKLLTKDELLDDFSLGKKDIEIDFTTLDAEIAQVDLQDSKEALPKAWKLSGRENQFFREYFESLAPEAKIRQCTEIILHQLSKINTLDDGEVREYVRRVIDSLSPEQLADLQNSPHIYLKKIRGKLDSLMDVHAEKTFNTWIEQGKISCEPHYALPQSVSPVRFDKSLTRTLYTAEEDMNGLERDVAWELANLPNIVWWHRNMSRTGFCLNGYKNAYPDMIALTTSGKILMIEPKGDHLENAESRQKVEIGRKWQHLAGSNYRYYMVFRDKDLHIEGAWKFDAFMEIVKEL